MDSMLCSKCSTSIDEDRAEFLVLTKRRSLCVNCSDESKKLALMDYAHKTAGTIVVLPNDKESQRKAFRIYRRSR